MTGLTFNEFFDKLYYGADIELHFNNWYYMINCGWEINSTSKYHIIEVIKSDQPFYEQKVEPKIWEEVYTKSMENGNENIESFLKAPIFDNKSFYDVEKEIVIEYS